MSSRDGRYRAALGGLIGTLLLLALAPSSNSQQVADQRSSGPAQQNASGQPKPAIGPVNAQVVQSKASDQRGKEPKDDPRDNWVIRALKFFDRHNGAFNAFAAIAVAFFTWRLWRLSVKEINALGQQSEDVAKSIAESARAADAMERVADAMGRSATTVEENMKMLKERTAQQMRAYVTVLIGGALHQNRGGGLLFEGKPIFLNTGATPAHKLQYRAACAVMDVMATKDFNFPLDGRETHGMATLNSQQSVSAGIILPDFIPDQDVFPVMRGHPKAFVVWGVVTYEDIFEVPHETKFGIIYNWIPNPDPKAVAIVNGHYTKGHNEAD